MKDAAAMADAAVVRIDDAGGGYSKEQHSDAGFDVGANGELCCVEEKLKLIAAVTVQKDMDHPMYAELVAVAVAAHHHYSH